jgi:PAS domain S-box-containing protein
MQRLSPPIVRSHRLTETLEAVFEAAADAIMVVDDGLNIVRANEAAARLSGQPLARLIGSPIDGWFPRRHRDAIRASLGPPRLPGGSAHAARLELRLRQGKTGRSWYASCSVAPIRDHDGSLAGAVLSVRDVTESRQMRTRLEAARRDLRALVGQMQAIEATERQRIARELHDELQQKLAAISLDLGDLTRRLDASQPETGTLLRDLESLVHRAIESTRRIVRDLRPQLLEELGLRAALEAMAANFESRTGVRTEVEILDPGHADTELDTLAATALYRVAQESLNNVLKHARARRVHLMLDATAAHQIELSVTDDGVGIAQDRQDGPSAYGLLGMAERVRAIGGRLVIVPQPEGGTMVYAIVPKANPEDRAA